MGATLDALQVLQQVELKLTALRSKVSDKKRSVRTHQRRIVELERQQAEKKQGLLRQQLSVGQLELEIKSRDAEVAKLRETLNRSKTNKEYAAILTQINTTKADNSKLEDRVLALMGDLESARKEVETLAEELHKEQHRLQNANAVVEAFERQSQAEFDALLKRREEAAAVIPAEALKIFERVAERHEGEALALVVQPHPKREEFICEGCNMTVTFEQYVALRGVDRIQVCINCGRVLFINE